MKKNKNIQTVGLCKNLKKCQFKGIFHNNFIGCKTTVTNKIPKFATFYEEATVSIYISKV